MNEPIDMVLFCPKCGTQHIDEPAPFCRDDCECSRSFDAPVCTYVPWSNPSHRSHLCHECRHVWRPADVPTNGVRAVKTIGKADSPVIQPVRK